MKQFQYFSILIALLFLGSCNKDDEQGTGTGDVIIVAKQSGENTVYGISIYAYTLSSFSNVIVTVPAEEGKTYTLKSNEGFKTNFYYETPESEYTTTPPAATTYQFSATFENGVKQAFEDILTNAVLAPPVILKSEYNEVFHQLETNWELLNGAHSYAINILEGTEIVFRTPEITNNTQGAYLIKTDGGGWKTGFTPESGKTYTMRLFAHMYEPQGGSFNIQAISMADKSVVWGN
jgi:hypothetical protein